MKKESRVLPEEPYLDKCVKQHKDEVEADKFATPSRKEELVETWRFNSRDEAVEESEASSEEVPFSEDIYHPYSGR